jgi:trk system potassium uptake protein
MPNRYITGSLSARSNYRTQRTVPGKGLYMAPHKIRLYLYILLASLSMLGVGETFLSRGLLLQEPLALRNAIDIGYGLIVVLYLTWMSIGILGTGLRLRSFVPDLFLSVIVISDIFPLPVSGVIVSFRFAASLVLLFFRTSGVSPFIRVIQLNPSRILVLSFLAMILSGTFLLMLPAATTDHRGADFIDALFTSASAVCVTGLSIKDTGTFFTVFGQVLILVLIQVGGLGIMTFSTLFTLLVGRRLRWNQEAHMREITESSNAMQMYGLVVAIVASTFIFECIGSIVLAVRFIPTMGVIRGIGSAIFHSVSAFCNAGFSLFPNNLTGYSVDPIVNVTVMILIVFGGLGFLVIDDIRKNIRRYNPFTLRWRRLAVHTRIVVITSGWLIIAGMLAILFLEFDNTLIGLGNGGKILAAAFQSVTCRTAGFNTIDIPACRDATLFVMILLMFIGASPASTGGGIKTTTLAVLTLAARAHLKSRNNVEVSEKTVPHETVYKAVAITLFSLSFLIMITLFLVETQSGDFLEILFEAVSAMGTVGLSAGMTPHLDSTGKLLIVILMFVGRVGPLSIALVFGEPRKVTMEYPTTRILVG